MPGVLGIPRPDVRKSLAAAPSDHVGFAIALLLPNGTSDLVIEVRLANGPWHILTATTVRPERRWFFPWSRPRSVTEGILRQTPAFARHAPRPLRGDVFPSPKTAPEQRPHLTIVTPSFQQAAYLPATLDSVLGQTGVRGHYRVQDGGSTDGSVDVLKRYSSRHPNSSSPLNLSWESVRDAGQTEAIARAFAATSGDPNDLMAWINSDDFYLPGALAFVTDYFARNPEVDVIYGHRILVDETSREIGRWFLPKHDSEVMSLNDFVPQETLFWRRRVWDKVGGLDKTFQFAMDWDFLLRLQAAQAKIVRVPYFLGCFRIHSAQKTSAAMQSVGQPEIDRLRTRTVKPALSAGELETNPCLLDYLRQSAWIEFLWQWGIRAD